MDLACELNPNDPWTLISAAMFHAFGGDVERSQELCSLAMSMTLSPTSGHWLYEANIRFLRGDDEGAIAAGERAQNALLTLPAWQAAALNNLGRTTEARIEVERFYAGVRANWLADQPPTDRMIGRWFMQVYPISHQKTWERLRDGIAAVGIPVDDLSFDGAPIVRKEEDTFNPR